MVRVPLKFFPQLSILFEAVPHGGPKNENESGLGFVLALEDENSTPFSSPHGVRARERNQKSGFVLVLGPP